ncbi:MAG: DMT family transporter [Acidimicrobiales bacterium]|nr:DMT family transporter [Acidimicrobiales bacterium]
MQQRGVLRCLAAAVLFGASAPAASELAGDMNTLVLAGLLYIGAGLAVTPHTLTHPPDRAALTRDWKPATVAVIAGGAIGPALLVAGLARTSAASASILLNLELAATVALAATIFREHLGRRLLASAALVTIAGAVLVWEPGATNLDTGALLIAAACIAWGFDNGVTARIDQLAPEHVVLLKGLVAGTANLTLGRLFANSESSTTFADVLAALAVGAAGYGASIVLWVKGARDLGAARGQLIFATAPFIGALTAWTALDEPTTGAQLIAIAIAAGGVTLSLRSTHEHEHAHDPIEHEHEHTHHDGHHTHPHPDGDVPGRSHAHRHTHRPTTHSHSHVPDLHHRHH